MKYYAVTEDPNELLHYGVKGMKWGQHIFGDKPKSAGFHRALGKLRAAANKAKTAVRNSATQVAINRNNRQQEKYNKAVQKTQKRINEIEGLNSLNRLQDFEKAANRQQKAEQKQARYDAKMQKQQIKADNAMAKLDLKYAKNERKMNKYIQQARQGKLKYGKLSDDQVQQITDRLSMERSARNLGSAEKTWRQQKKEAFRKGKLSGIERGTAAAMEEVARAGTIYGIQNFMNRKKLNAVAKQEGKEDRIKNRERNKRTRKEVRQDLRQEMYEEAVTSGKGMFERRPRIFTKNAAKELQKIRDENYESDRVRKLNARLNDEMDMASNEKYQKMLSDRSERERVRKLNETINNALDMDRNEDYRNLLTRQEEQKFLTDEAHNSARVARQNRENEERAERQREITAELAYRYGLFPGSNGGGGNKGKGGGNGGGGGASGFNSIDEAKDYYRRKYIRGETLQDEQYRQAERDDRFEDAARALARRRKEFNDAIARNEEGKRKAQRWVQENKDKGMPINVMPLDRNRRVTNNMDGAVVDNLLGEQKRRKRKGK